MTEVEALNFAIEVLIEHANKLQNYRERGKMRAAGMVLFHNRMKLEYGSLDNVSEEVYTQEYRKIATRWPYAVD